MRIAQRMQKYQTNVVQGLNLICPDSCSIKIRYEQLRKHESQLRKDRKTDKYEYIYIYNYIYHTHVYIYIYIVFDLSPPSDGGK